MGAEPRPRIIQHSKWVNQKWEEPMEKAKPFTRSWLVIAVGRSTGWGVLHAVNQDSLPIGRWAFFRRLDDGSRVS